MKTSQLVLAMVFASSSVACGPRISQWIRVTDCAQPHVVVPGVKVFIYEGVTEDRAGKFGSAGLLARGGETDSLGNTWGSFPVERGSAVGGYLPGQGKQQKDHPITKVAANPTEPVFICVKP